MSEHQPTKEGLLKLLNTLKKTDLHNEMLESNENDLFEIWLKTSKSDWKDIAGIAPGVHIYNYLHPPTQGNLQ